MTRSPHRYRLVAWALALALLGCGDDDEADTRGPCGPGGCSRGCESLPTGTCDILEPSCQRRVFDAVVCVRGTPGELPEVRSLTEEEYRAELEAAWASDDDGGADVSLDASSDAGVTQSPDSLRWSTALELLGLLAPGTDYASASIDESVRYVVARYEASHDRITLIDHGIPADSWSAQRTLAHEIVHALQDQTIGLPAFDARSPGSADGRFSRGCLVEGEAELYSELAWALLQGVTLDADYFDREIASQLKYIRRRVLESDSPYNTMWSLRYPVGLRYLSDIWLRGDNWGVRSLYESPPTSAIHWMVGNEATLERTEHLVLPLACDRAAVPTGYERHASYSLGAPTLFAFLGRALRDDARFESEAQWRNAMQWRQDDFTSFIGPGGEVAVSYRVRFGNAELAAALSSALRDQSPLPFVVHQAADELEVLAAEDTTVLDDWRTDPTACPPPEE